MSYAADPTGGQDGQQDTSSSVQVRLPLAKPIVMYVLLAANVICFGIEALLAGLNPSTDALSLLGAQSNLPSAVGQYWRLAAAMFLHAEPAHLAFNMYALFILGRDIEGFYGHLRFATIYFLSGVAGNVATYALGAPAVVSVGASGAIFGLIGAEIALLVSNRLLFGSSRRGRLLNLAFLVGINLAYGFANRRINNLAHVGGLLAGLALGFALTPRHQVAWEWSPSRPVPRLIDGTPRWLQIAAVFGACVLLGLVTLLGDQRWAALPTP
jgi:rhomboid protease GluP